MPLDKAPGDLGQCRRTADRAVGLGEVHQAMGLLHSQLKIGRLDVSLQLGDGARSRDSDDVRVAYHPGEGDLGRGCLMASAISRNAPSNSRTRSRFSGKKADMLARIAVGRCSAS